MPDQGCVSSGVTTSFDPYGGLQLGLESRGCAARQANLPRVILPMWSHYSRLAGIRAGEEIV